MSASVLWRRLDVPGHDVCRLDSAAAGWRLSGTAVFASDEGPAALRYEVACDVSWRTTAARVVGHHGDREVDVSLEADAEGRWRVGTDRRADLDGYLDVDLGFTPATNLLPIRRLGLAVGEGAAVRAAWLRVPSLTVEVLEQTYRREGEATYRYRSAGGFEASLTVDTHGFAVRYPPFWDAEP